MSLNRFYGAIGLTGGGDGSKWVSSFLHSIPLYKTHFLCDAIGNYWESTLI